MLEEIDTKVTDGQVLSQTPAAGTAHPNAIALVVARAPVVSYLQDLSAVNDDPDLGPRNIAGRTYPHSIYSTMATCHKRSTVEYNLGKHYRQVLATAGLDDSSLYSGGKILFEAFLDSRPVFAKTLGLGQAVPMRVSAQGALRLKLRLTYVGPRPMSAWRDRRVGRRAPARRPLGGAHARPERRMSGSIEDALLAHLVAERPDPRALVVHLQPGGHAGEQRPPRPGAAPRAGVGPLHPGVARLRPLTAAGDRHPAARRARRHCRRDHARGGRSGRVRRGAVAAAQPDLPVRAPHSRARRGVRARTSEQGRASRSGTA